MSSVKSPCIGICSIDDHSGLCEGCLRTGEEISNWGKMSEDQRRQVLLALEQRQAEALSFD